MKKCNNLISIFFVFILFTSLLVCAQTQKFKLQESEYRYENGKWYATFDGRIGDMIIPERLIVRLKTKGYLEHFDFRSYNLKGVSLGSRRFLDGFYVLQIGSDLNPFDVVEKLVETNLFQEIAFDQLGKRDNTPNDPHFNLQWNLTKIKMPDAWNITTGSSSVILSIIDSGIKYTHEDIDGNVWVNPGEDINDNGQPDFYAYKQGGDLDGLDNDGNGYVDDLVGWDFAGGNNNPQEPYQPDNIPLDTDGHGTNVAGIAVAQTNNYESGAYVGIAGVAGGWDTQKGSRLMILRDGGVAPIASLTNQAIEYAAQNGAKVINISSSFWPEPEGMATVINNVVNTYDVVIVSSAGSNGEQQDPSIRYPARYSNTIAVGAVDQNDSRRSYSPYGPQMDAVAPDGVPTTNIAGGYAGGVTGTSFSAPQVTGLTALISSLYDNPTWQQVRDVLRLSADKVVGMGGHNFTNYYGYGRINANKAVHNIYVPQVFSTIQSALNVAVPGQIVELSDDETISANIILPPGVSLRLKDGASMDLQTFYIVASSGSITMESGTTVDGLKAYLKTGSTIKGLFPTIQSAVNSAGFSQTVELVNDTFDENISITNKPAINLIGAANYGSTINGHITITNSSDALIENLKMHDWHRIIINGGTDTEVSNIRYMASSTLVNVYNGINTIIGGIEDGGSTASEGINCNNTSASIRGVNITDYDFAIWAQSNSTLYVSMNSNFCNNLLDEVALSGCTIQNIEVGEWSSQWPNNVYGNVTGGDPTDDYCTQKFSKTGLLASLPKVEPLSSGLLDLNNDYLQLLGRISSENRDNPNFNMQEYKPAFLDLISRYKLLLKKDSNNKTVNAVLSKLAHCYYTIDEKTLFKSYLDNLITSSSFSQFLPYIKRHYINFYVEDGDFESAISIAEQVFNSTIVDEDVKCEMLYEEGVIFKYYLNDIDKAMAAFAQIVDKYPNNNLYYFAKTELESENAFIAKKTDTINNEEVSEYATAVYPNPFNPSTKITYSIPERGNVILKVYDILGREIVQLVNEVKESGNYQVNFDGSNLNSGVYFYTIESGKYKASKKLLLVN